MKPSPPAAPAALLALMAGLLLAACGSAPRSTAPAPAPTAPNTPAGNHPPPAPATPATAAPATPAPRAEARPATPAGPRVSPLAAEQRWLEQLFEGTPVRISSEADGQVLNLQVPVAFSFEADSPKPKPALQAVLDKVGQSLKRQPGSKLRIGAPGPAARALAARQHLLSRGVAAHRVEAASSTQGDGVVLRLSLAAPAMHPASASH